MSISSVGLSGMRAAQMQLDTTAHNVANAQTPGFQRQAVALDRAGWIGRRDCCKPFRNPRQAQSVAPTSAAWPKTW